MLVPQARATVPLCSEPLVLMYRRSMVCACGVVEILSSPGCFEQKAPRLGVGTNLHNPRLDSRLWSRDGLDIQRSNLKPARSFNAGVLRRLRSVFDPTRIASIQVTGGISAGRSGFFGNWASTLINKVVHFHIVASETQCHHGTEWRGPENSMSRLPKLLNRSRLMECT